jgi:hypothetical protein
MRPKIDRAAQALVATAVDGECPHCGAVLVVTRRYLHKEMVRFLRRLTEIHYTMPTLQTVDSNDIIEGGHKKSTDATYLRFWGLLEIPKRGQFRPTQLGYDFIKGAARVPEWMEFLTGPRPVDYSRKRIYVHEVRGVEGSVL